MQNEETAALAEEKSLQCTNCTQLRQATSVLICQSLFISATDLP